MESQSYRGKICWQSAKACRNSGRPQATWTICSLEFVGGLVHPSYFSGRRLVNPLIGWTKPLAIRGMSHQVACFFSRLDRNVISCMVGWGWLENPPFLKLPWSWLLEAWVTNQLSIRSILKYSKVQAGKGKDRITIGSSLISMGNS